MAQAPVFEWLYSRGWCLVDFFFLISGMVFTHTYMHSLTEGSVTGRQFFFLRLSRIYPLHVATLLLCAALQWRMRWLGLPPIIYPRNDLYHFVLNLFFLHNGAFEEGYSYNGASWSVATEVFAYVAFFVVCYRFPRAYVVGAAAMLILGFTAYHVHAAWPFFNETVARTFIGFFAGSLFYLAMERGQALGYGRAIGVFCIIALAVVAMMASRVGYDAFVGGSGYRTAVPHVLGVFPLVMGAALSVEPVRRLLSIRPLTYLGDISYSVYMLHVPIQMLVLSVAQARSVRVPTESPWVLSGFVLSLLACATLTHRYVEVPARNWLRQMTLPS